MKQWYLSVCVKMPNVNHKVRIVILWRYKNDKEPKKILVTNRIHWNPERIVTRYRGRWSCTETLYFRNTDRDGKQELGLEDCQLRGTWLKPDMCIWPHPGKHGWRTVFLYGSWIKRE